MSPALRVVHPSLEPVPRSVPLAAARLTGQQRIGVLLEAAGLLSLLDRAGWAVLDWSLARVTPEGRLDGPGGGAGPFRTARPGDPPGAARAPVPPRGERRPGRTGAGELARPGRWSTAGSSRWPPSLRTRRSRRSWAMRPSSGSLPSRRPGRLFAARSMRASGWRGRGHSASASCPGREAWRSCGSCSPAPRRGRSGKGRRRAS